MRKLICFITLAIPMMACQVMAQGVPAPITPVTGPVPAQWLIDLVAKYPKLASLIFVVGALRLTLKPMFAFLHQSLPAWGLVAWDQSVTAVEQSKPIKMLYFVLDYLGSIKMPVAQDTAGTIELKPPQQGA